jgi:hypothetical protein
MVTARLIRSVSYPVTPRATRAAAFYREVLEQPVPWLDDLAYASARITCPLS